MEEELRQPLVNKEEDQSRQDNEANFDLPLRLDEYEEEDDDCKPCEQGLALGGCPNLQQELRTKKGRMMEIS